MKEQFGSLDEERWQAVKKSDEDYDGVFYYGVKTTGIFCRPSCKSKTPLRNNVVFFHNPDEAIKGGFRPCKRCCPDKAEFKPDIELVKKCKDLFDKHYNREIDLSSISKELCVSANHMTRLFKLQMGLTPLQYIMRKRVERACELLTQNDMDILEIAYMAGFKSLSGFYKCFKEFKAQTPGEYKRSIGDS